MTTPPTQVTLEPNKLRVIFGLVYHASGCQWYASQSSALHLNLRLFHINCYSFCCIDVSHKWKFISLYVNISTFVIINKNQTQKFSSDMWMRNIYILKKYMVNVIVPVSMCLTYLEYCINDLITLFVSHVTVRVTRIALIVSIRFPDGWDFELEV